ncbi:MAG: 3-oxoadipate enol-lactonase [Hyphomicrobiales bacterium]|nr:3-oxoadipate enol-lactonase [Hyphomicrobiales bacterium]
MMFARVNGAVAHYKDEGPRSGPALVLINALGTDFRIWDEAAAILSASFRILRYDKRGHGLSEAAPDRYDMADYAQDLAALADEVGIARATVVGLSIGGLIAQELYRQRPRLFAALVLADTAAKIGTDESWDARTAAVERGGVEAIADAVLQGWFTADLRAQRPEALAGVRAMLTRTPKQAYLAACGALKRTDLRAHLPAIAVPTLCLVGEDDGSTPVALVRETAAAIGGSRFEVVKRAGHLANLEQAQVFASLVAEHVAAAAR